MFCIRWEEAHLCSISTLCQDIITAEKNMNLLLVNTFKKGALNVSLCHYLFWVFTQPNATTLEIVDFLSLFAFQTFKTNHCRKLLSLNSWLLCSMAFILQKTLCFKQIWLWVHMFAFLHFEANSGPATPRTSGVLSVTIKCYLSSPCLTSASSNEAGNTHNQYFSRFASI